MRGSSLSGVCPSAGFTFDLLGGVGGCGTGQLSGLLLILCGLRLLLSGLFVLSYGDGGREICASRSAFHKARIVTVYSLQAGGKGRERREERKRRRTNY